MKELKQETMNSRSEITLLDFYELLKHRKGVHMIKFDQSKDNLKCEIIFKGGGSQFVDPENLEEFLEEGY